MNASGRNNALPVSVKAPHLIAPATLPSYDPKGPPKGHATASSPQPPTQNGDQPLETLQIVWQVIY